MVVFWILLNCAYIIIIVDTATKNDIEWINAPGHTSFIEVLAMYMAGMVVFKVISGYIHIAKMKWQYNCNPRLSVKKIDL